MATLESVVGHKLKDITECYVCKETMTDPQILPCLHIFCVECLQWAINAGGEDSSDALLCPICWRNFSDPQFISFFGLKSNLYMKRLIKIKELMDPCESFWGSCFEFTSPDDEMYCRECDTKLCAGCCANHTMKKTFRKHELFTIRMEETTSQSLQEIVVSCCDVHEEQIKLYCTDCSEANCLVCFKQSHQNHRLSDLNSVANNFRGQIRDKLTSQSENEAGVMKKKHRLDQDKIVFLRKVEYLKSSVNEAREDMVRLVDEQADLLLEKIDIIRKKRLNDFEAEKETYSRYQTTLESFRDCCINMITMGSSSDVCWARDDIIKRIKELDEEYVSLNERELSPLSVYFKKSEIKENIVGQIKDERFYNTDPELSFNFKVKMVDDIHVNRQKAISGLAILDTQLFFTRRRSSTVQIIDLTNNFLCQWKVADLRDPRDLRSCERNLCLYIIDWKYKGNSNVIFRVDSSGKLLKKWSTGSNYGRISVTNESTVLLAVHSEMKLNEYSCEGQLLREITLKIDTGAKHPWHAVSLPSGQFLVSLHANGRSQHRLCVIDHNGDTVRSAGQMEQIDDPVCLAFDGDGSIIVADQFKNRLLLYDLNLELKKEIISETDGLFNLPLISFELQESTGRLFVTFCDEEVNNIIQVFSIWN